MSGIIWLTNERSSISLADDEREQQEENEDEEDELEIDLDTRWQATMKLKQINEK